MAGSVWYLLPKRTANRGLLVLLEVIVYEAHHQGRLDTGQGYVQYCAIKDMLKYLPNSCFAQQDQLDAAARLWLCRCIRHCGIWIPVQVNSKAS